MELSKPSVMPFENRYSDAPRNPNFTIDQQWDSYSAQEHDRWDRLFNRMQTIIPGRACTQYLTALNKLELSFGGIPNFEKLSARLKPLTGWQVVPVAELVPDDVFFDHLANKRFPAGAFIRPEEEFDYLKEPDVFHDIYGHVPLLADPVFANFMEAYGKGGQRALNRGQLHHLARLYWYTVEFGLIKSPEGLRIFGAGILSSAGESVFALDDASPNRIHFDMKRIMRTNYIIDDFQQTYFVIDSFENLLEQCYQNFSDIYDEVLELPDFNAKQVIDTDNIINAGTHAYFENKASY